MLPIGEYNRQVEILHKTLSTPADDGFEKNIPTQNIERFKIWVAIRFNNDSLGSEQYVNLGQTVTFYTQNTSKTRMIKIDDEMIFENVTYTISRVEWDGIRQFTITGVKDEI